MLTSGDYNTPTENERCIWAFDLESGGCKLYFSIGECSRDLHVPANAISKCCQGIYKSSHGYKFMYYCEDYEIDELKEFRKHSVERYRRRSSLEKERGHNANDIVAVNIATRKYRIYTSFTIMCRELMLGERNAYRCLNHSKYHKSVGGYSLWRVNEVKIEDLDGEF